MDIIQNYEIEDISKKYTRKEFLKKCTEPTFTEYDIICPEDLGLKNNCKDKCIKCWKEAIKNIKFKGENEMEKYKTYEMVKLLSENPSKKFFDNFGRTAKNIDGIIAIMYRGELSTLDSNEVWEEVQEPKYFMNAINSGQMIKFKYNGYESTYNDAENTLIELLDNFGNCDITNVLNKKCWYVEED